MTLRTGKSGAYRYYTCSACARKGKTACPGQTLPMDFLDRLVVDQLSNHIFTPERLSVILSEMAQKVANEETTKKSRLADLQSESRDIDQRLDRLYEAIEQGVVNLDAKLKDRVNGLKNRKEELQRLIASACQRRIDSHQAISPDRLERFAAVIKENLHNGPIAFRKAYLGLFISKVEVDKPNGVIRLIGPKKALENGIKNLEALGSGEVPTFVQVWRPLGDSNPCYRRERAVS